MSKLVGLVGWRGMVGSVLMDRMQAEGDFDLIEPVFFSTSNAGGKAPAQAKNETTLQDAFTTSTRSSAATSSSPPGRRLHHRGVPQAARRRLERPLDRRRLHPAHGKDAVIILDPVNMPVIKNALAKAARTGSAATAPSAAC
jgi:aspartate-semialdehyde dehydrogenase